MSDTRLDSVSDERVIDAVADAYHAHDDPPAGVPRVAVAEHCPLSASTLKRRLSELAEAEKIERAWGLGPNGPRRTYWPLEEPDA